MQQNFLFLRKDIKLQTSVNDIVRFQRLSQVHLHVHVILTRVCLPQSMCIRSALSVDDSDSIPGISG